MKLPIYCIVGARPVKAVRTVDGGMDILAYDWDTGEFRRDMNYLTRVVMPAEADVDFVSEAEFERYVTRLRAERGR